MVANADSLVNGVNPSMGGAQKDRVLIECLRRILNATRKQCQLGSIDIGESGEMEACLTHVLLILECADVLWLQF